MICPNCQTNNRDGAKFCDECGTRLDAFVSEEVSELQNIEEAGSESLAQEEFDVLEAGVTAEIPLPQIGDEDASNSSKDESSLGGLDVPVPVIFDVTPLDLMQKEAVNPAAQTLQIPVVSTEQIAPDAYSKPESAWKSGGTLEMPRVEGANTPSSTDFRAPDPNEKKLRRKQAKELRKQQKAAEREARRANGESGGAPKPVVVCIVVALVAAAIAFGTYSLEMWGGKTVPSCEGETAADATFILENAGFSVRVDSVPSDDTEGLVLLTNPAAGARVPEGSEVVVHVATSRVIPEIVNMNEADALAALSKSGYDNVADVVYEKSDDYDGIVLAVDPVVGTKAKSATKVTVTVAQAYTVPDVSSLSEEMAIQAVKDAGFRAKVSYVQNSDITEGFAFGSEPAAGTKLKSDSAVTIQVSVTRATQLREKTANYLESQGTITLDGSACSIVSVDSTKYVGDGVVSFVVTAQPYTTLWGMTVYGTPTKVSGEAVFNDNDQLMSIG